MASDIYFAGTKNSLKKIFGTVSSISREAIFEFEKDLISTTCHDTSKTAYLEMKIKKNYFSEFKIEKNIEIGVNVPRMLKIIEICADKISVSINEEISVISKDKFDIEAQIPQIHIEREEIVIPKYNYTTSAILRIEHLNNNLSHLSYPLKFSDFVEISVDEKIKLKAASPYGDRITIDIPVEQLSTLNQKDRSIVVSIDMINKVLSNFEDERNIRLNMDESLPTIELVYEEENLYIRSLFSRY